MKKNVQRKQTNVPQKKNPRSHGRARKGLIFFVLLCLLAGLTYWLCPRREEVKNPYAGFDAKVFYSNKTYCWKRSEKVFVLDGVLPKGKGTWDAYYEIMPTLQRMKRETKIGGKAITEYFAVRPVLEEDAAAVHDFVCKSQAQDPNYFGHEPIIEDYAKSVAQVRTKLHNKRVSYSSNKEESNVILYSTDNENFKVIGFMDLSVGDKDKEKRYYNISYVLAHPAVSGVKGAAYPLVHGLRIKWFKYGDAKKIVFAIHKANKKSISIAEHMGAKLVQREDLGKEWISYNRSDDAEDDRLNRNMVYYTLEPGHYVEVINPNPSIGG